LLSLGYIFALKLVIMHAHPGDYYDYLCNEKCLVLVQEILGYVDINLSDVVSNKRINEKYHLIDSKNGKIQIELTWNSAS